MNKVSRYVLPLMVSAGILFFTACQKEENDQLTSETETVEAETLADTEFNAIANFVDQAANQQEVQQGGAAANTEQLPACANQTYNFDSRTLTIDFGTTNCLCRDGRTRRGKIIVAFTGPYRTAGAAITITLQDYYVNDNRVTGTKTRTFITADKVNITVRDASIQTPSGTIKWNANRQVERVAGSDTRLLADDVYLVSGSSEGVNRRNVAFTTTIIQPLKLVMAPTCVQNFVAGVVRTTTARNNTLELNYDPIGGEPCDKIADITLNGRTKRITLR